MILLDTGYLIALVEPRDELHERAIRWTQTIHEPLVLTSEVAVETLNYFSATGKRVASHDALRRLRGVPNFEFAYVDQRLFDAGLNFHSERPDQNWSLTDCISFVLMQERGIRQALAHDHHFEQAGFIALLK